LAAPARADQTEPKLDRLFTQLALARNTPEIDLTMREIGQIWLRSGSDSVDLLMTRAGEAAANGGPGTARAILDTVIELKPEFAEAWRQRGAILAAAGEDGEAIRDLRKTLDLEPRHFGAWDQMGRLLESQKDYKSALECYRNIIALIPFGEGLRTRIELLEALIAQAPPPI
jgi:tetratricopeptide (TPR) repeat protein